MNRSEADIIQKIVENVEPQAQASTKALHLESCLFGIDLAVGQIYQKLSLDSSDVRALGICGMGGIGKTTLAKAFFNKYYQKFDISCFMENVKEIPQGGSPLLPLLQQLLIELLRKKDFKVHDVESALRKLKEILSSKKALIVLDDLDQSSYSELLVRICKLFSDGSRVIITTRDANLPNQLKVEMLKVDIFFVQHLDNNDSLELFIYHAFKKPTPPIEYLSQNVLTDVSFWKAKLEKVKKIQVADIQKILQLSYDELGDETEKAIFLDIVFFFVGKNKDEAILVLKSCDLFPDAGIPILVERCLLTIDECNRIQMHNLIQDMGRNIICEESKHGRCRCLYLDQEEACQALQNLREMDKIEGLIIDLTRSTDKYCHAEIFERLPNLRLLKLVDVHDIKGNFITSFHELRFISWHGCPWTHLSSDIHLQKLVSFDIAFSRFETLWKDAKLPSLHHLNVERCEYLKELPESIGQLTTLDHFNARDCVNLKRLPKPIAQLTALGCLDVKHCRNLKLLPEQLGDMKGLQMLDASETAIEILPDSIAQLQKLTYLNVKGCKKLKKLPEQFGNMQDSFSYLFNLDELYLSACNNLTSLPKSIWKLKSLQTINLNNCSQLKRLPEQLGKMQCLEQLYASNTAIEELRDSIGLLRRIQFMDFSRCEKLTYVLNSISNLTSLVTLDLNREEIIKIELPDAVDDMKLEDLDLSCNVRVWLPRFLSFSSLRDLWLQDECGSLSPSKPINLVKLFNLEELVLTNCTSHGSSFPELPLNLKWLRIHNHASLEQVPDLSNLKQLKYMSITECCSLQSVQKLPPHLSSLTVCDCTSLQYLPDLSMLRDLAKLNVINNRRALKVSIKDSHLQVRQYEWSTFHAILQNREIAEWFDYKNRGSTVCFDVPPNLGDDFVGVAFWVVCHCINEGYTHIKYDISNKTEGMTSKCKMESSGVMNSVGDIQSIIQCKSGDEISIKSGDKVMVSFHQRVSSRYSEEIMAVKMCGAYIIKGILPQCNMQL